MFPRALVHVYRSVLSEAGFSGPLLDQLLGGLERMEVDPENFLNRLEIYQAVSGGASSAVRMSGWFQSLTLDDGLGLERGQDDLEALVDLFSDDQALKDWMMRVEEESRVEEELDVERNCPC